MSTFVIGDVQGCYLTLRRLLATAGVRRGDRVLFVGDLVNRGPRSLEVLRWVADQGERADSVLGNHDLHLLGLDAGVRRPRGEDTLEPILRAPDRPRLLRWLRSRPLLLREGTLLVVHAGLPPALSLEAAEDAARSAEKLLVRGGAAALGAFLGKVPSLLESARSEVERLAYALRAFTRIRACTPAGRLSPFSGPPEEVPRGMVPWYLLRGTRDAGTTLAFGHWAAMGLRVRPGLLALDSGCAWGGHLTAVRVPEVAVFQEPYAG